MGDREPSVVRTIAALLVLAIAALLVREAAAVPNPRPIARNLLLALGVAGAFHIGLFLAPTAKGWGRLLAGALMTLGALMYFGFFGQQLVRIARGYPVSLATTTIFIAGTLLNVWQLLRLLRDRSARPAFGPR